MLSPSDQIPDSHIQEIKTKSARTRVNRKYKKKKNKMQYLRKEINYFVKVFLKKYGSILKENKIIKATVRMLMNKTHSF